MSARKPRGAMRVALSVAIATTLYGSAQFGAVAGTNTFRVVVPEGVYRGDESGAELLHDYGAFQLYAVDGVRLAELRAVARGAVQVQKDVIEFEAAPFDPQRGRPDGIPVAFRAGKPPGPAMRVVQFAGPTVDSWLDAVRATGASVVQYVPNNAYLVLADAPQLAELQKLAAGGAIVHADTLDPWFKLNAALARRANAGLGAARTVTVTVMVATHGANAASKGTIASLSRGAALRAWSDLRGVEATTITIGESDLPQLAQLTDVVAIEEYVAPQLQDEVQNQIIAGNFAAGNTGPSAPGYLAFLTGLGFSTTPGSYPIVSVVDDGVGNGSTTLGAGDVTLTVDGANTVSRVVAANNCTTSPNAGGVGGHGHINSSIVGGYDTRTGLPFVDALGYRRGQGLNPWARIANVKIFTDAGSFNIGGCGGSMETLIRRQQDGGVAISSNSWGASVNGDYNADSRAFDIGTRDADLLEGGSQPMVFVFAAGNDGSGASTVGSPSTAKNVITVGASENRRPNDESGVWTDGCFIGATGADNAMDVINFSSRGPAEGGRIKPEVIAPGTHVNGTASTSTSPLYDGTGVCDQYRPTGQTVFAASSGTSHSTPAIAGVASLVHRFIAGEYGYSAPSAALTKAYLVAHPTYLSGVSGNGNLPTNAQGYGMPNLGAAFDATTDRIVLDQETTFGASGEFAQVFASAVDPAKPVRIVAVYSDAPGATAGNPVVNNLDLAVTNDGNTYRGNVFTGQFSATGGTADAVNNYEAVFLPAGTNGLLEITVTAFNVAGDGVPGNADTTDQDFALVCTNCTLQPIFTVDATPESLAVCSPAAGNFGITIGQVTGFTDPVSLSVGAGLPAGATATFDPSTVTPPATASLALGTSGVAFGTYVLTLTGTSGATTRNDDVSVQVSTQSATGHAPTSPANGATSMSTTPTLTWTAATEAVDYVVEVDDDPGFGSINRSATVTGTSWVVSPGLSLTNTHYWRVRARNSCGETTSAASSFTTGELVCTTYTSANVPLQIGPNAGTVTNSTLAVAGSPAGIVDLDVIDLRGTHTFTGDMDVDLLHPGGQTLRIFGDVCGGADNFDVDLDDSAATVIGATGTCPITGSQVLRPQNPLSTFNEVDPNGTWTMRITDDANGDAGNLQGWGLRICVAGGMPAVVANDEDRSVAEDGVLAVAAPGVLGNDTAAGALTAAVATPPASGTLALASDGGFEYTPAANFCGADAFTYQATDGVATDTARVAVAVACVNDAPVAAADAYTSNEDTVLTVGVPSGVLDNDDDPVEGSPITAVNASDPARGSVVLNPDGSLTYTPDANRCGPDTFTYSANDGSDDSAPATVTVAVTCINDAPVAVADALAATEDVTLNVAAPGVLANDTDVEASPLAPLFPSAPAHGSLTLGTAGSVSYVPEANYCGSDAFTYRVTDGELFSPSISVDIAIACVDDPPVAVADAQTVVEDAAATPIDVVANDTDIDAGPRSVASVTQPANGAVVVTGGGTGLTFQPAANYCGAASFTYTLDGGSVGTVAVTVTCVNDAPRAAGPMPPVSRVEGTAFSLVVANDFGDVDGDTLSYGATGLPPGLTINPATGEISGTIAIGAAATSPYTVVVTARDPGDSTATQAFTFTVTSASNEVFSNGFE